MMRAVKDLIRYLTSCKLQDHHAGLPDDQLKLRDAHQDSPAPPGARPTADNEASNLLSQKYFDLAQKLRQSVPSTCTWLEPEELKIIGGHPVAAGGSADIWEACYGGRKVALKSYRCYTQFNSDQVYKVSYNHRCELHSRS